MQMTDNNIIIKFIDRAVSDIYKKYRNIASEEINLVGKFVEKIEKEQELDFYDPYLDYKTSKDLAGTLENVNDIDLVKFYIFLNLELELNIDLIKVRKAYDDLDSKGYIQIQDYLIYFDWKTDDLGHRAIDILADELEFEEKVMELFDVDEITYMWIFGTTKKSAAQQYVEDNTWYEAIGIEEIRNGYYNSHGSQIYYGNNENGEF